MLMRICHFDALYPFMSRIMPVYHKKHKRVHGLEDNICYTELMQVPDDVSRKNPYLLTPIKRDEMIAEVQKETSLRMDRISHDFSEGLNKVTQFDNTVTIFGSARFKENHRYYQMAQEVGGMLSKLGYTVVTGGGGGIMEAGNRGAYENGGKSVGFNIKLPQEQVVNPYINESVTLRYFFARKVILAFSAQAYIYFPGGFGTLDELFEIITLLQTRKIPEAPVILVGSDFWNKLDKFIIEELLEKNYTISPGDEKLYTITDDPYVIEQILVERKRDVITDVFDGTPSTPLA